MGTVGLVSGFTGGVGTLSIGVGNWLGLSIVVSGLGRRVGGVAQDIQVNAPTQMIKKLE